jgi:hypothetical protein
MDWAKALAGFNDVECETLGELCWYGEKKTKALVGAITQSAGMDDVGFFKNESCQITIQSNESFDLGKRPRANDTLELRNKVWRVHEVQSFENDAGFLLTIECLPKFEAKHPFYSPTPPSDVASEDLQSIQAQRPVNVISGLLANLPSLLVAECTPANPQDLTSGVLPTAPSEVLGQALPDAPSLVEGLLEAQPPSLVDAKVEFVDLFLIAGQSNAHGHSAIADLTTTQSTEIEDFYFHTSWHAPSTSDATDQQYFTGISDSMELGKTRGEGTSTTLNATQFGIEWGFAKKIKTDYTTSNKVGVVKYAVGASTIDDNASFTDWDTTKTTEAWGGLVNAIDDAKTKFEALGLNVNWKGFLWYQGESNGGNDPTTYQGHLETLLSEIETKLGLTNMPATFVAPADQNGNDMVVNDAFNTLAREQSFYDFIKASDHHDGTYSDVHLSAPNMYDAGEDAGVAMVRAVTNTAPTSTEFEPSTMTTLVWLDMDDRTSHGITGTSWNEPVTTINDKSGNGYQYTPSSGSSIRSITNVQNGKNIFRFNGNVDATNVTNIAFDSTARHKWFFVARVIQFDAHDTLFLAQGNGLQLILFNRTGGAGVFTGEWYVHTGTHLSPTSTNILNQWVMLAVEWDIPNLRASTWLNGTAYNTNVSNSVLNKITTMQTRLNKYTNIADSDWGELILTENITQDQSDKIEGYLTRKWGLLSDLPTSHPYKYYTP